MRKYEILEKTIKKMVLNDLSKYDLPDNFSDVAVDIYPFSTYGNAAKITILMKEPFTLEDSDVFDFPLYEIKRHISVVFSDFLNAGISSSISTEENYNKTSKPDYDERKKLMENKSKNIIITEKQFNMIVSENDDINLRRRLSSELYNEIVSHQKIKINESSLNRLYNHIKSKDCAVITAFRKQLINCKGNMDSDEKLNIKTNKGRNISLKSALLSLGYGVTNVKGTYIENYLQDNSVEVKEDSYFVVNLNDDSNFIENISKLGMMFCQDSVLIFSNGGTENFLLGTNDSEFPGFNQKFELGSFKPGLEGEFMTKVGGRPFVTETFDNLQINTKRIVLKNAEPILYELKKYENRNNR